MARNTRIRGQDVNIQFTIDGVQQSNSLTNITDFNVSQQAEVLKTDFVGKSESTLDFQHSGWDFDFSVHVGDVAVQELLRRIVANDAAHLAHPAINMTVIYAYRDAVAQPKRVETYTNCVLKADESVGGRKEFVTFKFSGSAERRLTRTA